MCRKDELLFECLRINFLFRIRDIFAIGQTRTDPVFRLQPEHPAVGFRTWAHLQIADDDNVREILAFLFANCGISRFLVS
jgi:hypothetical protein